MFRLFIIIYVPICLFASELNLESFRLSYLRTINVIQSEDLPIEAKTEALDELFSMAVELCEENCGELLDTLNELNDEVMNISQNNSLMSYMNNLKSSLKFEPLKKLTINSNQLGKLAENFKNALNLYPKEDVQAKVITSIKFLRSIIALEETLLFNVATDKDIETEEALQLKKRVDRYQKQAVAVWEISQIINNNPSGEISIEETKKIVNYINDLGLFYIKFAQSVSNCSFLFSDDQQELFKAFQDDIEPMSKDDVISIFQEEFGKHPNEIFHHIDIEKPLAAGSIGQTYVAQIKNKKDQIEEVIVKVRRKGLEDVLGHNKKLNRVVANFVRYFSDSKFIPYLDMMMKSIIGMEEDLYLELDFANEIKNMKRFLAYFALHRNIAVPLVYDDLSKGNIITMTKASGENIEKFAKKNTSIKTRKKIFSILFDALIYQSFFVNEVHADLHPGNVFAYQDQKPKFLINPNKEKIILNFIDFGQVMNTKGIVSNPVKAIAALVTGKPDKFVDSLLKLGELPEDIDITPFRNKVKIAFKESGILKTNLLSLYLNIRGARDENLKPEKFENLVTLFQELMDVYKFTPDKRFAQFFRTYTPSISLMIFLGKEIPKKQLVPLIMRKLLFVGPKSYFQYFGSRMIFHTKNLKANISKVVAKKLEEVSQFFESCASYLHRSKG